MQSIHPSLCIGIPPLPEHNFLKQLDECVNVDISGGCQNLIEVEDCINFAMEKFLFFFMPQSDKGGGSIRVPPLVLSAGTWLFFILKIKVSHRSIYPSTAHLIDFPGKLMHMQSFD